MPAQRVGQPQHNGLPGLRDSLLAHAKQGRHFALMIDEFEIMAGNPAFDA